MHDSPPEINTVFALIPMDADTLTLSPAQRWFNAAASLFAYEDDGQRHTTITPRKLADLTGCALRTAQLAIKSHLPTVNLTLHKSRFVRITADDPICRLEYRAWSVMVAVRYLSESAGSSSTSHTVETIARYCGLSGKQIGSAVDFLESSGFVETKTWFDRDSGKRRRTIRDTSKAGGASTGFNKRMNGGNSMNRRIADTRMNGKEAHERESNTRMNGKSDAHERGSNPRMNGGNGMNKIHEYATRASSSREPKTVAAAGIGSTINQPIQSQNPDDPSFPLEIENALSRWGVTDQMAIIAAIVKHGADEKPSWLVKQLAQPTNAKNPVGVVIARITNWANVRDAEKAATSPVNAPQAGDDTLARHAQWREAHEARFWPTVPAALAADTGKLREEAGRLGYERFRNVDGAWRMSPDIADEMNSRYPDPSQTYSEQPERKAALNGTDTNPATDRNAEAFTVETFTGTPGTETPQPILAPAGGSTPDAVVGARTSLPTTQGRGAVVATRTVDDINAQIEQRRNPATARRAVIAADAPRPVTSDKLRAAADAIAASRKNVG